MPSSLRIPIALVLSIVCFTVPAWGDFQAGMDAYDRGDYATALHEWRPLAEQGNADAQNNLGAMYDDGHGVPQDYGQARQWYEKAATQGYAIAQFNLSWLYDNGQGVPQDYGQARLWYEKAAAQGYANAQSNLAVLYDDGDGVPQDFVQAHKWYSLAVANGNKHAAAYRDMLARQMTPAQIAEAEKLAREWKPTTP